MNVQELFTGAPTCVQIPPEINYASSGYHGAYQKPPVRFLIHLVSLGCFQADKAEKKKKK